MASGKVFQKVFDRGYNRAGNSYEKQVAELCPDIFQEDWLICLRELGTPSVTLRGLLCSTSRALESTSGLLSDPPPWLQ